MEKPTREAIEKYIQDKIDELNRGEIELDYFILCLRGHFEDGDFKHYDYKKSGGNKR